MERIKILHFEPPALEPRAEQSHASDKEPFMRQRMDLASRPLSLFLLLGFLPLLGLLAACAGAPPPAAPRPAPGAAPTPRTLSAAPALLPIARPASLPVGDPAAEGIDPAQLAALVERAAATSSDALVILKNGKLVGEWYFGKPRTPIETMSVTKSVVGLAVGLLIDEGKVASLDVPVHGLFPEWNQGRKRAITLRHLVDHTSGLQADAATREIYASPDFVKLALAAELSEDSGSRFRYNNKAVNLLAGVVQSASGERLDRFLDRTLFQPIGIREHEWELDKAGNPHGMSGLGLHPVDLARIGQLMLWRGAWGGARVLSQDWVEASTRPGQALSPTHSLLWWLIPEWAKLTIDNALLAQWRGAGADPVFLRKMAPLAGQVFGSDAELGAALQDALKPDLGLWQANIVTRKLPGPRRLIGPIIGYRAEGYLGQHLVVLPAAQLVAVRMRRSPENEAEVEDAEKGFGDFESMVRKLPR
jgi:CubicO group peptidase (beta-lactamase class C family)